MDGLFLPHSSDRQTFATFRDVTPRTVLLLEPQLGAANTHTHGYTQLPYTASVISSHISATPEVYKRQKSIACLDQPELNMTAVCLLSLGTILAIK